MIIDKDVQALLDRNQLEDAVVLFVKQLGGVSVVELDRLLSTKIETTGEKALYPTGFENIVLWAHVSPEFSAIITKLLREERIYAHASSVFIYMVDGRIPRLPVAKQMRQYKNPHRLPVVFNTTPAETTPQKKSDRVTT